MRLTKGLKSSLCCLVIISVVMMVAGPAWAESLARQTVKTARIRQGNPTLIKPAIKEKSLSGAVAKAVDNGATQGNKKGAIGALLKAGQSNVAVKGKITSATTSTIRGVLGQTVKMSPPSAVKAPKVPLMKGQTGKIQLNSPVTLKGVKKFK